MRRATFGYDAMPLRETWMHFHGPPSSEASPKLQHPRRRPPVNAEVKFDEDEWP
jgi:hypothetical protein